MALSNARIPAAVTLAIIQEYPGGAKAILSKKCGPAFLAVENGAPIEVIDKLLALYPKAPVKVALWRNGNTLLHYALKAVTEHTNAVAVEVARMVFERNRGAAKVRSKTRTIDYNRGEFSEVVGNETPLHCALHALSAGCPGVAELALDILAVSGEEVTTAITTASEALFLNAMFKVFARPAYSGHDFNNAKITTSGPLFRSAMQSGVSSEASFVFQWSPETARISKASSATPG